MKPGYYWAYCISNGKRLGDLNIIEISDIGCFACGCENPFPLSDFEIISGPLQSPTEPWVVGEQVWHPDYGVGEILVLHSKEIAFPIDVDFFDQCIVEFTMDGKMFLNSPVATLQKFKGQEDVK